MTTLDIDGRHRLAVLQERYGAARFQDVGPSVGTDPETGLALTIDAARRVAGVRVPDAGLVRSAGQLRAAVRTAFQDADLARAQSSRAAGGEAPPRGTEVDVTPLLGPSRPPRGDIVRRTRAAAAHGVLAGLTPTLMATGRSGNGYLTVTVGPTGVVEDVAADPEWLLAAPEHYLETALEQACHEASLARNGDSR